MKYSSKYKFVPILLILSSIIASRWQRKYPPWDPTWNFFELPQAIFYFLLFLYFLYDRVQMKRFYENEEVQTEPNIRKKHLFSYVIILILLAWMAIDRLLLFCGYDISLFSILSGMRFKT